MNKLTFNCSSNKHTILFLLTIMLFCILTGCGSGNKEVELTTDNISDYLEMNLSYGECETHSAIGIKFSYVDVILDAYPVVSGSFNNVEITAEISCPPAWDVTSSDPAYSEDDTSLLTLTFRLPADGKYNEVHNIGSVMGGAPTGNCKLKIVSVSGTFTAQ